MSRYTHTDRLEALHAFANASRAFIDAEADQDLETHFQRMLKARKGLDRIEMTLALAAAKEKP